MMLAFGTLISLDTIGPITPVNVRRNKYILSTRDQGADYAQVPLQQTKTDAETDLSFHALYPNEEDVKEVRIDPGSEFR